MLLIAHTMNAHLIVCLGAMSLLAGWVPAGARDSSAPPVNTATAESPQPAVADGISEAQETDQTPNNKLAATVLGEEVRTSDVGEMQEVVLTRLFDRYAEEQGIAGTNAEIDAYRHYLEERQAAGDFTIRDKAFEDVFWRYSTDDTVHDFFQPGSEEEAQVFATPPWEPKAGGK